MSSKNEKLINATSFQDQYEGTMEMEINGVQLKERIETTTTVTEDYGVSLCTTDTKYIRSIKGSGKIGKQEDTSSSYNKEVTQTVRKFNAYGESWIPEKEEGAWTTETSLSEPELAEFEEIWIKLWHPKVSASITVSLKPAQKEDVNNAPQDARTTHEKSRLKQEHEKRKKRFWLSCW